MDNLAASAGWGLLIGASLVAGAIVASATRLPERLAALLTAFGGGVLLAAVALELVPKADAQAGTWGTAIGLLAGMLIYVGADAWLTRDDVARAARRSGHAAAAARSMALHPKHSEGARGKSIAVGLFIDGVPESIAVGDRSVSAACRGAGGNGTVWSEPVCHRNNSGCRGRSGSGGDIGVDHPPCV